MEFFPAWICNFNDWYTDEETSVFSNLSDLGEELYSVSCFYLLEGLAFRCHYLKGFIKVFTVHVNEPLLHELVLILGLSFPGMHETKRMIIFCPANSTMFLCKSLKWWQYLVPILQLPSFFLLFILCYNVNIVGLNDFLEIVEWLVNHFYA